MKAIRVHTPGGPDALLCDEIAVPTPGPGQALVKVAAAGVNYIDVYHRTGLYKMNPPVPIGMEGAGTVEACGPDVAEVAPGDTVASLAADLPLPDSREARLRALNGLGPEDTLQPGQPVKLVAE